MMRARKVLSLILTVCLLAVCLPMGAVAADGDFTIQDGVLTKYNGSGGDVVIPDGVKSIDDLAFNECKTLTSVTMPDSVTSIGSFAFGECSGLTSIKLSSNLERIYRYAFYNCTSLKSIVIPSGVKSIAESTFSGCSSLASVKLPDCLTSIGDSAFWNCSALTSIQVPNGVTAISDKTFWLCTSLALVELPDGLEKIGWEAFRECKSLIGIDLPESLTEIGSWAFSECTSLVDLTIPENVTSIGEYAFYECTSLVTAAIHGKITQISKGVFSNCKKLSVVSLPNTLQRVYDYGFGLCELDDVYFNGTKAEWDEVFAYSKNGNFMEARLHCTDYEDPEKQESGPSDFRDVKSGAFYEKPVKWAVKQAITKGTSDTTFSPGKTCTRAEAVTFLWRSAGSPRPDTVDNPFTDVKTTDYFYHAVLWAKGKNITSGTSATRFSPNKVCNRGEIVTFLYRSEGAPEVNGLNPFRDVNSKEYYGSAVFWAVDNGVTKGTSKTTFSPAKPCNRGEIVTFLYRAATGDTGESDNNSDSDSSGGSTGGGSFTPTTPSLEGTRYCAGCGGKGRKTCIICNGRGYYNVIVSAPEYFDGVGGTSLVSHSCRACGQTGYKTCSFCGGDGRW